MHPDVVKPANKQAYTRPNEYESTRVVDNFDESRVHPYILNSSSRRSMDSFYRETRQVF